MNHKLIGDIEESKQFEEVNKNIEDDYNHNNETKEDENNETKEDENNENNETKAEGDCIKILKEEIEKIKKFVKNLEERKKK